LNKKTTETNAGSEAFTVIELLVVVTIIAILATLLLTGISRAKGLAHGARCKSNLRQLGIALNIYADENRYYPIGSIAGPNSASGLRYNLWFKYLEGTVSSRWPEPNFTKTTKKTSSPTVGIFNCPGYDAIGGAYSRADHYDVQDPFSPAWGSYAYNASGVDYSDAPALLGLGATYLPGSPLQTIAPEKIFRPVDMISFSDSILLLPLLFGFEPLPRGNVITWYGFIDSALKQPLPNEPDDTKRRRSLNLSRHGGRFNVAFLDGHVEVNKPPHFFGIKNNPGRAARWNNDNQDHLSRFIDPLPAQ
jgi:prepilin-type processing-associated H-X9-DG protein